MHENLNNMNIHRNTSAHLFVCFFLKTCKAIEQLQENVAFDIPLTQVLELEILIHKSKVHWKFV